MPVSLLYLGSNVNLLLILRAQRQKGLALSKMELWTVDFVVNAVMNYNFGEQLGVVAHACNPSTLGS